MTDKPALRRDLIARIRGIDPAVRTRQEAALVDKFEYLTGFAEARTVLLYLSSFPEEIPTRPLICRSLDLGKRVVCPKADWRTNRLRLREVRDPDADVIAGRRGLLEPSIRCPSVDPAEVDWVLVPGLGFDRRGFRLGRGAGHYDRLLPELRAGVLRWALILDAQWLDAVPTEPHDVPVDGVADHRESVRIIR